MEYSILKTLHIFSAILLVGTGFGSAFHKYLADREGDLRAQASANRHIVLADWFFTVPTVVIQPITGAAMAILRGYSLTDLWLAAALGLYGFAALCWIPAVFFQIQMRDLAMSALATNSRLPPTYHRLARMWFWLGVPAFLAMIVIVYLMVAKPR